MAHTLSPALADADGPLAAVERSRNMSGIHCSSMLAGLVLYTLGVSSDASGAEPSSPHEGPLSASANAPALPLLAPGESLSLREAKDYPATEFRPHGRSLLEGASENDSAEVPGLRSTTGWQRMTDFHSRDRVRVLTLWKSGGGTLSLQAGKGGSPSLQWTSSSLSRGEATRGLLDRFLASSVASVGNSLRRPIRAVSVLPGMSKPVGLPGSQASISTTAAIDR
jgi:hypothetical protein